MKQNSSKMPANESSHAENSKLFIKNMHIFTNIRNDYSLKKEKITVNYASTTNQINIY